MNVPQLRFDGFDGEWIIKSFDDAFIIIDGDRGKNYPSSDDYLKEGHCLFLNAKNVTKKGFSFNETVFINESKDKAMTKGKIKRDDLVMTTRGTIGNVALYSSDVLFNNIRINSGMVILRSNINDSLYDFVFLNSPKFNKIINFTVFGSAQPQLTVKDIKKMKISFPQEKKEQQRIALFFSQLNRRIDKQQEKIEKLEQFKKGMMQKIFSQELRFKDEDGGEFGDWENFTLGDIAIIKGRLGWKGLKQEEYVKDGAYLVAGKHIKKGVIQWEKCDQITDFRYQESIEIALEENDIIFSKDGSLGNPALVKNLPKEATINSTMMLVRIINNIIPNYLYQILLGPDFKRLIHLKVSGSSIPHLFQADMKEFEFLAPSSIKEQNRISLLLENIDTKMEKEREKLTVLEEQKKGFLQRMFV